MKPGFQCKNVNSQAHYTYKTPMKFMKLITQAIGRNHAVQDMSRLGSSRLGQDVKFGQIFWQHIF